MILFDCDGFYGVGVLLASILPSLGIILVPHHNVILYPEYWYEIIFLTLGFFYLITINNVLSSETVLSYSHDDKARIILSLCLVATLSTAIVTSLVHLVWSFGLGYNSPMPFVGYFILYFVTDSKIDMNMKYVLETKKAFNMNGTRCQLFATECLT